MDHDHLKAREPWLPRAPNLWKLGKKRTLVFSVGNLDRDSGWPGFIGVHYSLR